MKHRLVALLTILPALVASTSVHAHLEGNVEVAMVDPADLSPPQNANDMATGKSDVAHIAYTLPRPPSGATIFLVEQRELQRRAARPFARRQL